jgi:hypothetical protein
VARLFVLALTIAVLAVPPIASSASAATPKCNGVKATIVGTSKADIIYGTNKRDVIVARSGKDKIFAKGGKDLICAGKGDDQVRGGDGPDKIFGEAGDDGLKGGAAFDRLRGGTGTDLCWVGTGGGSSTDCEEADLRVTITAAASAEIGEPFEIKVVTKNIGVKSTTFDLVVEFEEHDTACGVDHSGTYPQKKLLPTKKSSRSFISTCGQMPGDPYVELTATAEADAVDDDSTNDSDSVTVDIVSAP